MREKIREEGSRKSWEVGKVKERRKEGEKKRGS